MPFLPPNQQRQSTEGTPMKVTLCTTRANSATWSNIAASRRQQNVDTAATSYPILQVQPIIRKGQHKTVSCWLCDNERSIFPDTAFKCQCLDRRTDVHIHSLTQTTTELKAYSHHTNWTQLQRLGCPSVIAFHWKRRGVWTFILHLTD